ncbi:hypothetical protein ACINWC743_1576 [Acinetobacter sp. WC-743]|uniref:hypothetical protein n=1 Tax=Acinetobacter sp. WC-743 TaxID=903945 RepID=UPI0002AE9983|nr:hypothetical protein [Acinetobacter sp. WC-743]ELW81964.1 hypothetical protein ACINWC743_1576 [Acinetobacter sp. WC-743]
MTLSVTSALATAFLQLAENPVIEVHNIDGLGDIGIKQLSLAAQQEWASAGSGLGLVTLLKNTVCDPHSGDLVLKQLPDEELKKLPLPILNNIVEKVYKQNGIAMSGDKNNQSNESVELKNSQADQS